MLVVDIHAGDMLDSDLEGASSPAVLLQALAEGIKIFYIVNRLHRKMQVDDGCALHHTRGFLRKLEEPRILLAFGTDDDEGGFPVGGGHFHALDVLHPVAVQIGMGFEIEATHPVIPCEQAAMLVILPDGPKLVLQLSCRKRCGNKFEFIPGALGPDEEEAIISRKLLQEHIRKTSEILI